jgi:hypothetical protein
VQSLFSTWQNENLQKKIDDYESRLSNFSDMLVEDEVILYSLKTKLIHLDWAIMGSKKHVHFVVMQRQTSEDVDANFEIIQLANAKLKEAEDGHKDLANER